MTSRGAASPPPPHTPLGCEKRAGKCASAFSLCCSCRQTLAIFEFEGTRALGAALLAGMGTGIYEDFAQATPLARSGSSARRVEPNAERAERYEGL